MIAMKFTIELDIGLSFLVQAALPPASDRSRDEDSSSFAVQADRTAIADAALKIPEAEGHSGVDGLPHTPRQRCVRSAVH